MALTDQLGLNNIDFGGIGSTFGSVFLWVLVFVFFGGIIWFVWWILSFKDTVIIKEPIGEGFEYKKTDNYTIQKKGIQIEEEKPKSGNLKILPYRGSVHRAKIIKKHGVYKLILFSPAKTLKIPDNVFQAFTKKGKKFIELTKISEHIFAPTVLIDQGTTKYIYDESYFSWVVNDIEDDQKKYAKQSFWDKYGTFIVTAATLVLCMIIIVVVLKQAQKMMDTSISGFGEVAESFKEAATIISSQKI